MEQTMHNRVYINPNFKRTEKHFRPIEPKTTHFNRHYLEDMPRRETTKKINPAESNKRKIYVNPNFLSSNNTAQNEFSSAEYYGKINENLNKIPNMQLLHKSKYSLVQNVQHTMENKEHLNKEINKHAQETLINKKLEQEVPLTRSRYCIIRRKKRLSVATGCKGVKNYATEFVTTTPVPSASNNVTCYSNLNVVKNGVKMKMDINIPDKMTKIKITKYKMIPASYLKKNTVIERNKNKFVSPSLKSYLKNNWKSSSSLITLSKNRFKIVNTNTPVSTIKAASRITAHKGKGVLCSGNKVKLSSAKFNINNIPCRLFTKYGKCLRQAQGNCKYLHDQKHVSLCYKFLKGICHDKNCTLSHELTDKKMPTCFFYLNGMCNKECCPYLHVKLSDKTKICQEFLKGYCENGDKCLFRHIDIDKLKKAKKVLPTSLKKSKQRKLGNTKAIKIEIKNIEKSDAIMNLEDTMGENDGDCRYYKESVNNDASYETIKPKRCKLGTLPSFIQL